MNKRYCGAALLLVCVSLRPAAAHHSRAHFLLDEFVEIDGVVTEVSWRSPHVYYQVTGSAAADGASGPERVWTLEGHSIPGFLRMGWGRDTLELGARVTIMAHPNRQRDKPFAMLYSATGRDGITHYAYSIPAGVELPNAPDRAATGPSTDFSGTWRHMVPVREAAIGSFRAPTEWPLTPTGREQADAFDINDDPVLDCVPLGVPRLILATYSHQWTRHDDHIVIRKERSPQVRTIDLVRDTPPSDFVPNELGYSTGWIEADGTLVVETTGFTGTRWGNSRGLDSSAQKQVTERYRLIDGGFGMDVEYTIVDPVYLTEPVTIRGEYRKSADYAFVEEQCDAAVARRHLSQ